MAAVLREKPDLDDFPAFYRAAHLIGSPDLFRQDGAHAESLMFLRTPFYAWLLQPLSALPYATARLLWLALMSAALILAVWLWPGRRTQIALALCWAAPLLFALTLGQDVALVMLLVAVSARLWMSGREVAAGLTASLLALKVTFLLPVALVFLARSRRGTLAMAAGLAAQAALSFAVQGPRWIQEYIVAVQSPKLDQVPAHMLSFRAFGGGIVFAIASAAVYFWIWRIGRRGSIERALTVALPLGMVAAPHSYAYDAVVAIPLLVGVASTKDWRGMLALLALSPVPYLLMITGTAGAAGPALIVGTVLICAGAAVKDAPDAPREAQTTATAA
jgi:hypothetical protein